MAKALDLAGRGRWNTAPNPRVGCILVKDGHEIASGWHAQVGGAHAEAAALAEAGHTAVTEGATAYVTLEPCNHHGRTPPCTEALIAAGISRVVVGMRDPDPRVSGSGLMRLQQAGLEVELMEEHTEGRWLNRRFLSSLERQRPWIVLKCAVSADGFADPPRALGQRGSLPITRPALRALTHAWRAEEEAILVGAGTVVIDDPALDVREAEGPSPAPIVIDPQGRTPRESKAYLHPRAAVVGGPEGLADHVTRIPSDMHPPIEAAIRHAHDAGFRSVLVEGGPATLGHFLQAGLWDEARWCTSPRPTSGGLIAPPFPGPDAAVLRGEHAFGEDHIRYAVHHESVAWVGMAPPPTLHLPLPS